MFARILNWLDVCRNGRNRRNHNQNTLEFLRARSCELGQLYELAVEVLRSRNPQKYRVLCFAGREICDRLPLIVVGKREERLIYKSRLERLCRLWTAWAGKPDFEDSSEPIPIPQHLYIEIETTVADVEKDQALPHSRKAEQMFEFLAEEEAIFSGNARALANQWNKIRKKFSSRTHVPADPASSINENEKVEIEAALSKLENILENVARDFGDSMRAIDDILEETNRPAD